MVAYAALFFRVVYLALKNRPFSLYLPNLSSHKGWQIAASTAQLSPIPAIRNTLTAHP